MGASEVDGKLILDGRDSLTIREDVDGDDIDLSDGSYVVSKEQAAAFQAAFGDGSTDTDTDTDSDPKQVFLQFRATGGQLFSAFTALQVLSEMADEQFIANVSIDAKSAKPIDRNKYETAVVMSLDEEDIKIIKS